jgi:hypothetical protein
MNVAAVVAVPVAADTDFAHWIEKECCTNEGREFTLYRKID